MVTTTTAMYLFMCLAGVCIHVRRVIELNSPVKKVCKIEGARRKSGISNVDWGNATCTDDEKEFSFVFSPIALGYGYGYGLGMTWITAPEEMGLFIIIYLRY